MPSFTSITCKVLVSLFKTIPFSTQQSTKEGGGGGIIRLCTDSTPPFQKIETYCIIINGLCHKHFSFRHPLPCNECSTFFCFIMNVAMHARISKTFQVSGGVEMGSRNIKMRLSRDSKPIIIGWLQCWFNKLAFSMRRGGHPLSLPESAFRSAYTI